ncbi:flagellar filament capping protein FliD [Brevibacillus brevis]|uniref:flagellar filament capping protein FliD n=1 Tax=Brevibacillus brevis TaxID=1393 RepID=UPI00115B9F10|nr:flagellar filament capping protein FliD [Lysinibacillus sp. SDF0063]TQR32554.1 flagellar hook protein [Lysinibacillus sp. SDF0063]
MGIRMTGMASGMDTEKMIKDLMKAQRQPVNRLEKSKISTEWKRDAYREMNTLLADLQKTVNDIRYSSNFNKKVASSENDAIASAKVTGTPKLSSYSIEVQKLAKSEMPASMQFDIAASITSSKQQLGASFEFAIDGDTANTIKVEATDTIDSVIAKINGSGKGVEAFYIDNKLVIKSINGNNLGGDNQFDIKVQGGGDGSVLGMTAAATSNPSSTRVAGEDAVVVINGVKQTSKSNVFKYDGVEFTVKTINTGNPLTINAKTDEEAVFNSIKGFVEKYNNVIETINKKIAEPKYKGYQPLLDEEKEALGDKTAEKMDKMAKSGILIRDSYLTSALNDMRRSISAPLTGTGVNSAFDTLSEIGVGGPPTGKSAYQENGKLYLNEEKLRNAISSNGADVVKLFTSFSSSTDTGTKYNESGIAERLYSNLNKAMTEITKQAGSGTVVNDDSYLSKKIGQMTDDINSWEDRLKIIENRYYKQFASMETAMSKAQSQGSWFAQMLGQK